jgi:hypothetical protein
MELHGTRHYTLARRSRIRIGLWPRTSTGRQRPCDGRVTRVADGLSFHHGRGLEPLHEIVKRETIEAFHEEKDTFHGRRERTSLRSGAPRRRPVRNPRRRGVGRAFLFQRGGPAAASRFEQFRGRERIRRPGGSASVGTGGNGLREGGAGFRPCVRTARGDRPPSSFRPRRSPRKRAPPFVAGAGGFDLTFRRARDA